MSVELWCAIMRLPLGVMMDGRRVMRRVRAE
jgi:hypothetical protein